VASLAKFAVGPLVVGAALIGLIMGCAGVAAVDWQSQLSRHTVMTDQTVTATFSGG